MPVSANEKSGLRVLMTADAVGGVWQYALDLAEGLLPHRVETILAVLGPAPSADQAKAANALGVVLIQMDLPLDWVAERPEPIEDAGRSVAQLADELRADLVHLNSPALAAGADFACPVVAVCHSCVATWWREVRQGPMPEDFVWRTELVRQGYHAANKLLAPTSAFAQLTAHVYGLPEPPSVVRNGRRSLRVRGDRTGEPFVFSAGRLWDEAKNLAALDRAASRLALPVLAAGPLEGPNGASIALPHLTILGRLSEAEIARHLSARPIFVSTAYYEPFGLAVLEAAQAGCALVLSDIPTFRELWEGVAVFIPPDDDVAIAHAVEDLSRDDDAREMMARAARERANAYSQEAMSRGVLAAYHSMLSSARNDFSTMRATA